MGAENVTPIGMRSPVQQGLSTSLYRLRYPVPQYNIDEGTGINSSQLYRYKVVSSGLNNAASCEHGNELWVGFLFYLENPQLLKKDSVRWRQLVWQFVVLPFTPSL